MLKTERRLKPVATLAVFVSLVFLMLLGFGASLLLNNFAALHWFALVGIFFWVLFHPSAMPLLSTFFIGLMVDGLEATPFGFYGLGFLAVHQMIYYQRRFLLRRPFNVIWTAFVLDTLIMALVLCVIMWMIGTLPNMRLLVSLGVLWAMFPVVYILMNSLFERLIEEK